MRGKDLPTRSSRSSIYLRDQIQPSMSLNLISSYVLFFRLFTTNFTDHSQLKMAHGVATCIVGQTVSRLSAKNLIHFFPKNNKYKNPTQLWVHGACVSTYSEPAKTVVKQVAHHSAAMSVIWSSCPKTPEYLSKKPMQLAKAAAASTILVINENQFATYHEPSKLLFLAGDSL